MKRVFLLAAMISFSSFLYGMEPGNNLALTYNCEGTKITLLKEELYRRQKGETTTVTVAGVYQQLSLQEANLCDPGAIGDVIKVLPPKVYVKNALGNVDEIVLSKTLVSVVEPVVNILLNRWRYHPKRRIGKDEYTDHVFKDDAALLEARNDLALCYDSILKSSYNYFTEKNQQKNIAFPALSTFSKMLHKDAASVAVESTFFFLKDPANKDKTYEEIQFVVETDEDFNLYKEVMNQYIQKLLMIQKK